MDEIRRILSGRPAEKRIHIIVVIPRWDSDWHRRHLIWNKVEEFLKESDLKKFGYEFAGSLPGVQIHQKLSVCGDEGEFVAIGVAEIPDEEPDDYIRR